MRTVKEILDEYKSADMARRLNFYVQNRDLRDEFFQMDVKSRNTERTKIAVSCHPNETGKKSCQRSRWRKFFIHGFGCR